MKLIAQSKRKKNNFIFWLIFGLSPNLGLSEKLSERLIQKSETTYCVMFQSNVDEQRLITQFQISSWSDEECSIPWTRL